MVEHKLNQTFFKNLLEQKKFHYVIQQENDEYHFRNEILKIISEILKFIFTNSEEYKIDLDDNSNKQKEKFDKFLEEAEIGAIGVHLFDEIIGRKSFMNKISSDEAKKSLLFSALWLRTYNYLLKPSSSLINYFYDNEVLWENHNEYLQLYWEGSSKIEDVNCNKVNLDFCRDFIIQNQNISKDIYNIIDKNCKLLTEGESVVTGELIDFIFSKIILELDRKCIKDRLKESVTLARYAILNDKNTQKAFFEKIELLSFNRNQDKLKSDEHSYKDKIWFDTDTTKKEWEEKKEEIRHSPSWKESKDLLEAFQSIILNEYSFCEANGFFLYKLDDINIQYYKEKKELEGYLIVVAQNNQEANIVKEISNNLLKAIRAFCRKRKHPKKYNGNKLENKLLESIVHTIEYDTFLEENVFARWIDFVYKMSKEAISESKNIEFNIGIGAKYFHEVHLKRYIPPLDNLISTSSNELKIIHFLKSYYSLFGANNDKIIWFDEQYHFLGIFEYPNDKELFNNDNYKDKFLIAKIKGKDFFELYKGGILPVVRIRDNKFINLNNQTEIERNIKSIHRKINIKEAIVENFSLFVNRVINKTKITGSGTSYIIINDIKDTKNSNNSNDKEKSFDNPWKVNFDKQTKNLSARLKKYESPIISISDLKNFQKFEKSEYFENILNELLLLTYLDGSIVIRLNINGVYINPSQFAIPLIHRNDSIEHFDYFKLKNEGEKSLATTNIDRINNAFYGNRVNDTSHLESFIADIDRGNGFLKESKNLKDLTFLNSSGTKHHSLYGLSLSVKEPMYVVVMSEDGNIRIFWNGFVFYNSNPS